MRRRYPFLIACLLCVLMLFGARAAAAEASVKIRGVTIAPGEEGEVIVEISADEPVGAFEMTMYYVRGAVQFVSGTDAAEPRAGEIRVVSLGSGLENRMSFSLKFQGVTPGETVLRIIDAHLIEYESEEEQDLEFVFGDALVEVRDPDAQPEPDEESEVPPETSETDAQDTETDTDTAPEDIPPATDAEDPFPEDTSRQETDPPETRSPEATVPEPSETEAVSPELTEAKSDPAEPEKTDPLPDTAEEGNTTTASGEAAETEESDPSTPGFFGSFMIVLGLLIISAALVFLVIRQWGKKKHPDNMD